VERSEMWAGGEEEEEEEEEENYTQTTKFITSPFGHHTNFTLHVTMSDINFNMSKYFKPPRYFLVYISEYYKTIIGWWPDYRKQVVRQYG
jgi:hypothetical protein